MSPVPRQRTRTYALVLVFAAIPVASRSWADPVGVVKESGRTTGHAVRDGALTVGRTVRDFFRGGADKAKHTWKGNAARTRADLHRDKDAIKRESHE